MSDDAVLRTEQLARAAYGRLLAILVAKDGDIEFAEDCLADAFAQALRTWPVTGVPNNPEAWLLTVARNQRHDRRRSAVHRLSEPFDDAAHGDTLPVVQAHEWDAIPDRRLALLFVCAHPAIDPAARTPLMLQVVLGFDAEHVSRAFAVPPSAMAQRLVRAKRRIRDARIPFVLPGREQMPTRESLDDESLYLATTLAELLPAEPEALGLAALISLSIARRPARGTAGEFVPLEEQDTSLWSAPLIARGEQYLHSAQALGQTGRFQLEAAIQSAHCARATSRRTDWEALLSLHTALLTYAPTLGARVSHAAAMGRAVGARAGLAALDAIADDAVQRFQPAWATRAHLLAIAGDTTAAMAAFARAISLTTDRASRAYLERQQARLRNESSASA
jgi:predicted RNA polymerase sigma factor